MKPKLVVLWIGICLSSCAHAPQPEAAPPDSASVLELPGGDGGIGFDDLRYSPTLGRVLVPAGRTGNLDLVDPATGRVTSVPGFGASTSFSGGHGQGTTSVDEGAGLLFAIDRDSKRLAIVDPGRAAIVSTADLGGDPDYVRYVGTTHELWVTEPEAEQIEVFALASGPKPAATRSGQIALRGGPESLVVDGRRGRAYTHLWDGATVAIDLRQRTIVGQWPNGCRGSRGIALDEERGFLFVGCAEGSATVLDVTHDGRELSSAPTGTGVDIIDYDPQLGHLYVPAARSATLTILGVDAQGELSVLGTLPAAEGSHCATTAGKGRVYVGDPKNGRLLVLEDRYPPSTL